jgi:transposase
MERKKPHRHRSFTPEFKARSWSGAVLVTGRFGQVARDFDLTETAVRAWVAQAETECRGAAAADQRGAGLSRFSWVRR